MFVPLDKGDRAFRPQGVVGARCCAPSLRVDASPPIPYLPPQMEKPAIIRNLRRKIRKSLISQGFTVEKERIFANTNGNKDSLRLLHRQAVLSKIEKAKPSLVRYETLLLSKIASGTEVIPELIQPYIVEVKPDSFEEKLFRYASLHWSIPISSGYGRRLRFLVFDKQNGKLIGLLGLGDPVFALKARDEWIGWTKEERRDKLWHVMDAFVLGAVPPYSQLLFGKFIAMLVSSREVQKIFRRKYGKRTSLIRRKKRPPYLVMVTTTSALGRSSLYNRVKYQNIRLFNSVGYTKGSGEFHFSNGLYKGIWNLVINNYEPTAKHSRWGNGFRNRREVVRKALQKLNLSPSFANHGIQREVFIVPLAHNAIQFLSGKAKKPKLYNWNIEELFTFFRERWLLPRSYRDSRYKSWRPGEWLIWKESKYA